MANEFATTLNAVAGLGQQYFEQQQRAFAQQQNALAGMMDFSLRREALAQRREELSFRNKELDFREKEQEGNKRLAFVNNAAALIKVANPSQAAALMNGILKAAGEAFGIDVPTADVSQVDTIIKEYAAARTPEERQQADMKIAQMFSPDQAAAYTSPLRRGAFFGNMAQQPVEGQEEFSDNMLKLYLENRVFNKDTGERFKPKEPLGYEPVEMDAKGYERLVRVSEAMKQQKDQVMALQALSPDNQEKVIDAIVKPLTGVPLNSMDQVKAQLATRYMDLTKIPPDARTDDQKREIVEVQRVLGLREPIKETDEFEQAKIDQIASNVERNNAQIDLWAQRGRQIAADIESVEQQILWNDETQDARMKMLMFDLSNKKSRAEVAESIKNQQAAIEDQRVQQHMLKTQKMRQELAQLEKRGETLGERERVEVDLLKKRIEVADAQIGLWQAAQDNDQEKILQQWEKLDQGKQLLQGQLKKIDAQVNGLGNENTSLMKDAALIRKRNIQADKEFRAFQEDVIGDRATRELSSNATEQDIKDWIEAGKYDIGVDEVKARLGWGSSAESRLLTAQDNQQFNDVFGQALKLTGQSGMAFKFGQDGTFEMSSGKIQDKPSLGNAILDLVAGRLDLNSGARASLIRVAQKFLDGTIEVGKQIETGRKGEQTIRSAPSPTQDADKLEESLRKEFGLGGK